MSQAAHAYLVNAESIAGLVRDPQELTRRISEWRELRYHVIAPADQFASFAPGFAAHASVLFLSIDPASREVYFDSSFMEDTQRAVASKAIHHIARLAGVQWLPSCRRTDPRTIPNLWEFHVDGAYIIHDGTPQIVTGTSEVDLRDGSAQIGGWTPRKWQTLCRTNRKKRTRFGGTDAPDQQWSIAGWTQDLVMKSRAYGLRISETKAKNAAIRTLGLKDKYSITDLALPFVVLRFQYIPDMNDPMERQLVLEQRLRGVSVLYANVERPVRVLPQLPAPPERVDVIPVGKSSTRPEGHWSEGLKL